MKKSRYFLGIIITVVILATTISITACDSPSLPETEPTAQSAQQSTGESQPLPSHTQEATEVTMGETPLSTEGTTSVTATFTPLPTEYPPTKTPTTEPTSTPEGKATAKTPTVETTVPTATQPLAETQQDAVEYVFGEPQLLFETQHPIQIAQWLSGSNEELLVRSSTSEKFTIEILNIKTGDRKRLVETDSIVGSPVWLPATKQVAYLSQNREDGKINLFLSDADTRGRGVQIANEVSPPLVPASDGSGVLVFDDQMAQLQNVGQEGRNAQTFELVEPLPIIRGGPFARYQAAWSDKNNWIAYYNQENFRLMNGETGESRTINLGIDAETQKNLWVSCARWSPDGDKLALIVAAGRRVPLLFTKLAIFDPETEQLQIIEDDTTYVTDITWAPDNQQILMESQIASKEGRSIISLFLVHPLIHQVTSIPILPDEASQISFCNGLVWSLDGNSIALTYYKYPGNDGNIGWYSLDVEQR